LHIVHRVLRYINAALMGELLEQSYSNDHLHIESNMGRAFSGYHYM